MYNRKPRSTRDIIWDMIYKPERVGFKAMTPSEVVNRFEVTSKVVIVNPNANERWTFFTEVHDRIDAFREARRIEPLWIVLTYEQSDWFAKHFEVAKIDMRLWGISIMQVNHNDPIASLEAIDCRDVPFPRTVVMS